MKVLQENGLKTFMQSILNKFIKKEDTEQVTTVDVDTIPTNNSNHLITSGAVASALATKLTEPSSNLAVGRHFRIASIDENGHAVLECVDPPTPTAKTGSGTPTTSTVADYVGQDYIDTANNNMIYKCVAIDSANSLYYWDNVLQDLGTNDTTYLASNLSVGVKNTASSPTHGDNIVVGRNNVQCYYQSVGIGNKVKSYHEAVAIGYDTIAYYWGVALGSHAHVGSGSMYACQLGSGTNNATGTLQFRSHRLLEADGTIPPERITSQNWTDTQRLAVLLSLGCTVDENGFVKWDTATPSEGE